jgi:hypothetical protein
MKCEVQNINLMAISHQVKEISSLFDQLVFLHIYREHNMMVDTLSKEGLLFPTVSYQMISHKDGSESMTFGSMNTLLMS